MSWLPEKLFHLVAGESYSASGKDAPSFDLSTNDGSVTSITPTSDGASFAVSVEFAKLSARFLPLARPNSPCEFVLKSSLTQLGIDAIHSTVSLKNGAEPSATVTTTLVAFGKLAQQAVLEITIGSRIGKLFAPDPKRLIVTLEYLQRLDRSFDLRGSPLLKYGGPAGGWDVRLVNDRVVAFLPIEPGAVKYADGVSGLLRTIGVALREGTNYKKLLRLHQTVQAGPVLPEAGQPLVVRTAPLKLRTMFARVVDSLLPTGLQCMSSNLLEPEEEGSGCEERTFVFRGTASTALTHIPLEFYSLEAYREAVPYELRKTLAAKAKDPSVLIAAFATAPPEVCSATYVCKGSQFEALTASDWICRDPVKDPYVAGGPAQREKAERYLFQQAEYGILSAIACGDITSDGVLLTRYFPSPVLKSLLLSRQTCKKLRAVFFLQASRSSGSFFSQEDRTLLNDLNTFGIEVFHVDIQQKELYQFARRPGWDSGLMVPTARRDEYLTSTVFGVYGSNLVAGSFDQELAYLLRGIKALQRDTRHPKLNPDTKLALVTGGGPGAMEVGNRVAQQNGFLSCGMFVDFGSLARKPGANINEQKKNPYVEAYMTYRPMKLVERQSEFNLDFPIFLTGGVGTDFEYALEEVRRKVGTVETHPMILFGDASHWGNKITGRFQENLRSGTIKGSEWLSNVPYVVQTGAQALAVYKRFFNGTLAIGGKAPANGLGFVVVDEDFVRSS